MKIQLKKLVLSVYLASMMMFAVTVVEANVGQAQHKNWKFRVLLDDSEIGYHTVNLMHDYNKEYVTVNAKFDVSLFFIPVYSYIHKSTEVWQQGCVKLIETYTDDNGEEYFIKGTSEDQKLMLNTHNGHNVIKGCVRTFAYWDIELLRSQYLLNTQTGEYQAVEFIDLGTGQLSYKDTTIPARQYRLIVEDMTLDLWYTEKESRWLALEATTESGEQLRYLPDYLFDRKKI